jgi:hypothetical protein
MVIHPAKHDEAQVIASKIRIGNDIGNLPDVAWSDGESEQTGESGLTSEDSEGQAWRDWEGNDRRGTSRGDLIEDRMVMGE